MSVIGPRPALWNQDVLIAEREKYHANDVKPGLTGWAQINGRDELEIPVKAKLDGEYVEKESLLFDIKCFLGTIGKVAKENPIEPSYNKPKALMLASVASMIDQFNMDNIQLLLDMGYDVDVVCNCKEGNTISEERIQKLIGRLKEKGVGVIHVPMKLYKTEIASKYVS